MTIVNRVCKFCGKPLSLNFDDDYAKIRDTFKIAPYAACDRCASLRETRRVLTETIAKVLTSLKIDRSRDNTAECRQAMVELTKRYARMAGEWTNRASIWEEQVVDAIMQQPDNCGDILKRLWPVKEQVLL